MKMLFLLLALPLLLFAACAEDTGSTITEADLIGDWVETPSPHPGTGISRINADGTLTDFLDYDCNIVDDTGTWSLNGSDLTISMGGVTYTVQAAKINDDQLRLTFLGMPGILYRKGSVPYAQGANTATTLTWTGTNTHVDGTLANGEVRWYAFTANTANQYRITLDDTDYALSAYEGDVQVTVVDADMNILTDANTSADLVQHDEDCVSSPIWINPPTTTIYIIVEEGFWWDGSADNTFGLTVDDMN